MAAAERAAGIARAARWPAILIGFTVPISVAADNVLLGLVALGGAAALFDRDTPAAVLANPVVRCALALYALLALGTLYGERYAGDGGRYLGKYLELALLPLVLAVFVDGRTRRLGLYALASSLLLTLALSIGMAFGIVPGGPPFSGSPDNAAIFKNDLTHNFMMAFGAFLFLQLGFAAASRRARLAWWICAALAALDVLLLVRGRTGYLVLFALVLYAGYAWKGWRGFAGLSAAGALALAVLMLTPNLFSARIERTLNEAKEWQDNRVKHEESIHMRLEWYRNSLAIFADHPIVGSGTGSFPRAYAERTRGSDRKPTVNPHNEYLHLAVQIGAVGLAALLALFAIQWRSAARLATPLETHLARGLVIAFVIGCGFNSLLLDHAEGLFFAWLTALLYGGLAARQAA